jgi:hypothetical protein
VQQEIAAVLPQLLPMLLLCCRITQSDLINIIDTKDEDATLQPNELGDDDEEGGAADDEFEVTNGKYSSTLRNASAFALRVCAEHFPDAVFQILKPTFEQAFTMTL